MRGLGIRCDDGGEGSMMCLGGAVLASDNVGLAAGGVSGLMLACWAA